MPMDHTPPQEGEEGVGEEENMSIGVGDRIINNFTGRMFKVKSIGNGWVVLEQDGEPRQVLTEKVNLNLFYESLERRGRLKGLSVSLLPDLHP